jgi:23S rRNA maturation mini-RNase III
MDAQSIDLLFVFLIVSAIFIIIFFVLRELVMWYWKINKRIEISEKNSRLLEKLLDKFDKLELNSNKKIMNKKSKEIPKETDLNNPEEFEKLMKSFGKK